MMDKKWKKKWLKALRSGEYAQGRGQLCIEGESYDYFCCLGVLCDIIDPSKWRKKFSNNIDHEGWLGEPSKKYLDIAGLDYPSTSTLIRMNDAGKKFTAIANYIEKNL